VKRLPPFGLMLFSVGAGGALVGGGGVVVVVVVVGVVVDDGAWLPLVPQAAVNVPTAIRTTAAIRRRSTERDPICSASVGHLMSDSGAAWTALCYKLPGNVLPNW
jgi:hypothetical protein